MAETSKCVFTTGGKEVIDLLDEGVFKDIIPVQFRFMLDVLWFDISVLRSALLKLI